MCSTIKINLTFPLHLCGSIPTELSASSSPPKTTCFLPQHLNQPLQCFPTFLRGKFKHIIMQSPIDKPCLPHNLLPLLPMLPPLQLQAGISSSILLNQECIVSSRSLLKHNQLRGFPWSYCINQEFLLLTIVSTSCFVFLYGAACCCDTDAISPT